MDSISTIFSIIVLIMSVVVHEYAHGFVANSLGDPTAKLQGRLTLNPLKHLEWFGSFIVPLITSMVGLGFGWAKPVIINPYNFKNPKRDELLVALAGPLSNFILAGFFAFVIRLLLGGYFPVSFVLGTFGQGLISIFSIIVLVNITLAIFNLIPVPPLDGSKVLFSLIPAGSSQIRANIERFSFVYIVLVILVIWPIMRPLIPFLFSVFVGV